MASEDEEFFESEDDDECLEVYIYILRVYGAVTCL